MDEWMNKWRNDQMNERMNGRMNEGMNEWINEWMNSWLNEWIASQLVLQRFSYSIQNIFLTCIRIAEFFISLYLCKLILHIFIPS